MLQAVGEKQPHQIVSRRFPAALEQLYDMLDLIREAAATCKFPQYAIDKIELASEEAIVNIISYGYPNRLGDIEIKCFATENHGFTITIIDHGIPYNPLANQKKYEVRTSIEERTIGGYGIYFILKIMDEVNYRREFNSNVLSLTKYHS
jgi:anti-sigma regulatory factor (Ser/Thr protein kinase)